MATLENNPAKVQTETTLQKLSIVPKSKTRLGENGLLKKKTKGIIMQKGSLYERRDEKVALKKEKDETRPPAALYQRTRSVYIPKRLERRSKSKVKKGGEKI